MSAVLDTAQSVTTLCLRSNELVGATPAFYFPMTPLPQLTTLHIQKVCFRSNDGAGSAESFILQHPALRTLLMEDCPMYGFERQFPRPWATVLASLDMGMEQLVDVKIDGLDYCYEDTNMGWGMFTLDGAEFGIDGAADQRALEQFQSKIEARSRAELSSYTD